MDIAIQCPVCQKPMEKVEDRSTPLGVSAKQFRCLSCKTQVDKIEKPS